MFNSAKIVSYFFSKTDHCARWGELVPKIWKRYPATSFHCCPDSSPAREDRIPWPVMVFILSMASRIRLRMPSSWNKS